MGITSQNGTKPGFVMIAVTSILVASCAAQTPPEHLIPWRGSSDARDRQSVNSTET